MGFSFKSKGDWNSTLSFLRKDRDSDFIKILNKYGKKGVVALGDATPKKTGLTARSWGYEIWTDGKGTYRLIFTNSNLAEPGMPVAILIQYGHGTKSGTYVQGVDYINPALKPIFDKLSEDIQSEVSI